MPFRLHLLSSLTCRSSRLVLPLVFPLVKQDPVVGGKPPRSPILSRRSYLSPVRGRRVGGPCLHSKHAVPVQFYNLCMEEISRSPLITSHPVTHTVCFFFLHTCSVCFFQTSRKVLLSIKKMLKSLNDNRYLSHFV